MVDLIWPEFQQIKLESRRELVLNNADTKERVEKNDGDIDHSLYEDGTCIQYLKMEKIGLSKVSPKIAKLKNLTQLVISNNIITSLPEEFSQLSSLTYLDLSNNNIKELPGIFTNMSKLRTLSLRNNNMERIVSISGPTLLQEIYLDNNKLNVLPEDFYNLKSLMTVSLSKNEFTELSTNFVKLENLKTFYLLDNKINQVPPILSQISKLKQIYLKGNPLKGEKTQFKKYVADDLFKSILDYLRKNYNTKKSDKSTSKRNSENDDSSSKSIKLIKENDEFQINVINRAEMKRFHVIYFGLKNISFNIEKLRNVIKFQEEANRSLCDNRKNATVGMHDLQYIKFPLTYRTRDPDMFYIRMINKNKSTTGSELYSNLLKEAEAERKSKKRNTISGVYQYLNMVNISERQAVVEDALSNVISYPPITNSDITKLTTETTDILIEVIGTKLNFCKEIGRKIISWFMQNSDDNHLEVQPLRIFEDADSSFETKKLLVVFPDNLDLDLLKCPVSKSN